MASWSDLPSIPYLEGYPYIMIKARDNFSGYWLIFFDKFYNGFNFEWIDYYKTYRLSQDTVNVKVYSCNYSSGERSFSFYQNRTGIVGLVDGMSSPNDGTLRTNFDLLDSNGNVIFKQNIPDLTGLTIDKTSVKIKKFYADKVTATKVPPDAVANVHYYSSNPTIATVDENTGRILALKPGICQIVAETR